jgi:hypothetical protein
MRPTSRRKDFPVALANQTEGLVVVAVVLVDKGVTPLQPLAVRAVLVGLATSLDRLFYTVPAVALEATLEHLLLVLVVALVEATGRRMLRLRDRQVRLIPEGEVVVEQLMVLISQLEEWVVAVL